MSLGECRACHAKIDARLDLCPRCGPATTRAALAPRLVRWLSGVPAMAGGSVLLLVLLAGVVRSTRHPAVRLPHALEATASPREAASRAALELAHRKALASGMSEAQWQAQLAAKAAPTPAHDGTASRTATRE